MDSTDGQHRQRGMQQQNTACGVACAHVCGRGAQHMGSARSGLRGLRCGGAAHLRCRTRVSSDAARKRSLRLDAGRPMMSSERPSSSAEVQANGRWSRCRASRPTAGGVDLGKRTQAISDIFFFFNIFFKAIHKDKTTTTFEPKTRLSPCAVYRRSTKPVSYCGDTQKCSARRETRARSTPPPSSSLILIF